MEYVKEALNLGVVAALAALFAPSKQLIAMPNIVT